MQTGISRHSSDFLGNTLLVSLKCPFYLLKLSYFFFSNSRGLINKENIPSGFTNLDDCILNAPEVEKLHESASGYIGERGKPKRQKSSSKLSEHNENQDSLVVSE